MHRKTYSDPTSIEGGVSPPPAPPPPPPAGRGGGSSGPIYYVESPSQHDADKMSYHSSSTPFTSPPPPNFNTHNYHYHCSPIHHHHSRQSSTSRFSSSSSSLKPHHRHRHCRRSSSFSGWRKLYGGSTPDDVALHGHCHSDGDENEDEDDNGGGVGLKFYVGCFLVSFLCLFAVFSLILWASSNPYPPQILVQKMVFWDMTIQAGMDGTGVPTDMLSLKSTVRIHYKNPATFFGRHVTSTPLELYYYNLKVASGQMKRFYQKRKSNSNVSAVIQGHQVPLYGGMLTVSEVIQGNNNNNNKGYKERVNVPLNMTFTVRSRAYILGRLVKSEFYHRIRCPVTLNGARLGKPINMIRHCSYQ